MIPDTLLEAQRTQHASNVDSFHKERQSSFPRWRQYHKWILVEYALAGRKQYPGNQYIKICLACSPNIQCAARAEKSFWRSPSIALQREVLASWASILMECFIGRSDAATSGSCECHQQLCHLTPEERCPVLSSLVLAGLRGMKISAWATISPAGFV